MRLWSIHPSYLDTKGLVALWREGLLALQVLSGKTKGYTKHPQLQRFQQQPSPVEAIAAYLHFIVDEAVVRGYKFDRQKLPKRSSGLSLTVTDGQLAYETQHLKEKLKIRDRYRFLAIEPLPVLPAHPVFEPIAGSVASWEKRQS